MSWIMALGWRKTRTPESLLPAILTKLYHVKLDVKQMRIMRN